MQDLESSTLLECMDKLAALPADAQQRVMAYLSDRFLGGNGSAAVAPAASGAATATASKSTGAKRGPKPGSKRKTATGSKRGRKPSSNKKSDYELVSGMDFAPVGKQSLKDFMAKVDPPKRHAEIHAATIYYLKHVAGLNDINVSHVFTAEKHAKLKKLPTDLYQSIMQTSSSDKLIDTSNTNDLGLTPKGKTYVEDALKG